MVKYDCDNSSHRSMEKLPGPNVEVFIVRFVESLSSRYFILFTFSSQVVLHDRVVGFRNFHSIYNVLKLFPVGDFPGKWQYLRQLTESSDLKQRQIVRKWANRERELFGSVMKIRCLKNTRAYPELWGNAEAFAAAAHPPFVKFSPRFDPPQTIATILHNSFNRHYPTIRRENIDFWNDTLGLESSVIRTQPPSKLCEKWREEKDDDIEKKPRMIECKWNDWASESFRERKTIVDGAMDYR